MTSEKMLFIFEIMKSWDKMEHTELVKIGEKA